MYILGECKLLESQWITLWDWQFPNFYYDWKSFSSINIHLESQIFLNQVFFLSWISLKPDHEIVDGLVSDEPSTITGIIWTLADGDIEWLGFIVYLLLRVYLDCSR